MESNKTLRSAAANQWLVTALPLLFSGTFLAFAASLRFVAGDEGFYTLSVKLVNDGNMPYKDFFYPQMPLLPYALQFWSKIPGLNLDWISLRLFSAFLGFLTCLLVFLGIRRKSIRDRGVATAYSALPALGAITLAVNPLFFAWIGTVETYAIAALCIVSVVLICETAQQDNKFSPVKMLLAGIILGIGISSRLYLAALLPLFLFFIRSKGLFIFLAGVLLSSLPGLFMFISDPEAFWFNNIGYHLNRSKSGLYASLDNKLTILKILLGVHDTRKFHGILPCFIIWGGYISLFFNFRNNKVVGTTVLALTLVSFLPDPVYVQYFCLILPLLTIILFNTLERLHSNLKDKNACLRPLIIFTCSAITLGGLQKNIAMYMVHGEGVLGLHGDNPEHVYSISATAAVSNEINKLFPENAVVYSSWTGYLLETHVTPLEGTENRFGMRTAQKRKRTRLKGYGTKAAPTTNLGTVRDHIARRELKGVILRDYYAEKHRNLPRLLQKTGYHPAYKGHGVTIWQLKQKKS